MIKAKTLAEIAGAGEVWRAIPEFEDYYISSEGRIVKQGKQYLKVVSTKGGVAYLYKNGKQYCRSVSKLEFAAFNNEVPQLKLDEKLKAIQVRLAEALEMVHKLRQEN